MFGHVKDEHLHLDKIIDTYELETELGGIRTFYIPNPWTALNHLAAETVESPVLGDGYAGFGERHGETDQW
ncbi:MAG: hypothetical protein HOY76_46325 [Streptomyces sp.]|nr:hypothetical protein [Streptomyces sp.]